MPLDKKTIREIGSFISQKNILVKKEDLYCYGYDSKEGVNLPDMVVFPENSLQISKLLKLASKKGIYVTPRGAGTGTTGGCVPVKGGIVVCLSKMNKILEINENDLYVRVEPGVFTGKLKKEVLKYGLFYPPDPASSDFCTIGGNLGECAGGPKAVKYGVTRDYVLGLTMVIPTGEIIKTGVKTVKGVVGYDLSRLVVGSEGTLAIITEVTLKLVPAPEAEETMISFFQGMDAAANTVSEIIRRGMIPGVLEFMDESCIRCIRDDAAFAIPEDVKSILIIESYGKKDFIKKEIKEIEQVCFLMGSTGTMMADNEKLKTEIWSIRKSLSSSLFKLGPDKINEDITVPRSRLPDIIAKAEKLKKETGLEMASFGHAGDGNIHFNIMFDKSDKSMHEKALNCILEIFEYVLELGGTLSGEHGTGISKKKYIHMEIDEDQMSLIKRIKKAFDPAGILNPGKL